MTTDWEEVKRLAADFQRTQLCETLQRLSERNCVEIVKKLTELKLLDVIFTCDGKEYLTEEHLLREIEDELYASGGRISLSELVTILNVDYSHIEAKANQLSRTSSGDISLVLGQLVSRQYKDSLAQEIDLKLQQLGIITIAELTKAYDLTAEFIENIVTERLGTIVNGKADVNDPRIIVTNDYLSQYQSKITGILSAVTRPIALTSIINRYKFSERIFNGVVSDLISTKRLSGSLSGRTYIPDIYAKTQLEYVENFYKLNGYLDYSTLSRLGISNAQTFLQKRFGDELCYLNTCAVGQMLSFQVESSIEECILNNSWVDLVPVMPTILTESDVNILITKTLEQNKNLNEPTIVLCDTIVVSKAFIEKCEETFIPIMDKKADEDLKSGLLLTVFAAQQSAKLDSIQDDKKSDSGTKAQKKGGKKGGTGGAGSQGREVKTKAVKKKYKPGSKQTLRDDSDDESTNELSFLTVDEIVEVLEKSISKADECPPDFIRGISLHIRDHLRDKYETIARNKFSFSYSSSSAQKKKSFAEIQRTVNQIYSNILMFEKGIKLLDNSDLQSQLTKYLLRSLCSDIVNLLVIHFSSEDISTIATPEARLKLISKLDSNLKESFTKLNTTLNAKSVDDFCAELENCSLKCEIMLKKLEKKRERNVISEHRQSLILQINESTEAALTLNLAVLLLFQANHNEMVHASGKFVPQLISFLRPILEANTFALLHNCQELVIKHLMTKDNDEKDAIELQLQEMIPKVKEIAVLLPKKPTNE